MILEALHSSQFPTFKQAEKPPTVCSSSNMVRRLPCFSHKKTALLTTSSNLKNGWTIDKPTRIRGCNMIPEKRKRKSAFIHEKLISDFGEIKLSVKAYPSWMVSHWGHDTNGPFSVLNPFTGCWERRHHNSTSPSANLYFGTALKI